jgi:DNA-binding transcriptional ArsR family regulator
MSTTAPTDRPARGDDPGDDVVTRAREDVPAQLRLLDDAYAREILAALAETPLRGRDLIERCDASRSTVYRRLDRLQSAGLVTAETTADPNGHHCRTFRLVRSDLTVRVEDGAITVVARPESTPA